MRAVVKKRFRDKYTDEVYEAGRELELTTERYEEIRSTDADLIVAVAADPDVEDQTAAGQQGTVDPETEDQTAAGHGGFRDRGSDSGRTAGQTKQKRVKKQNKQGE